MLQGRHHIRVRVLDEIPAADFAHMSVETLSAAVRERLAIELGQADTPPRVAASSVASARR